MVASVFLIRIALWGPSGFPQALPGLQVVLHRPVTSALTGATDSRYLQSFRDKWLACVTVREQDRSGFP
jgi:hypothetical protein